MQKASAEKSARKSTPIKDAYTKTQLLGELAANTGLNKKDVSAVLDELGAVMERHLKKRGAGHFTLPGIVKVTTVRKPATKARKGINPFTKQEMTFKAKPARTVVKVRPLAKLKGFAEA